MNRAQVATLALIALGSGTALAQTPAYNPSWYVSPSLSLMDPDSRFGVDDRGEGIGLRFGKAVSPHWDIQVGPNFARSKANGSKYEQTTLGVDGLWIFSRERLRPFLLVGIGAERDKLSGAVGSMSKTSPYLSAGVGIQYSFNDQWSAQVDLRRVHGFLRDNTFGFDRSNNDYLTVGLVYTFEKPARPAPVVQRAEPPASTPVPPPLAQAPAPQPKPQPQPAAPAPRFEKVTLSATELFEFDSANLRTPQPRLDEIAQALNDNPQLTDIDVIGYTDRLGSEAYNLRLSQRRADAVKNYLTGKGVAINRLRAEGKGEANPVVNCTEKNRARLIECLAPNRRVEVEQIVIERRVN